MTFEEFLHDVIGQYEQRQDKSIRLGQLFFNELCVVRPSIAEEIRGSMLDPFFKERITQVVQDFVRDRW
jgi:hypothetical protein